MSKPSKPSKPRKNLVSLRALLARGGAGAGTHHNRSRDVATGRSRKNKHRGTQR